MSTPAPAALLPAPLVEDLAARLRELAGERVAAVFRRALRETVERTLTLRPDGSAFVVTGDIPAMWLRDSTAQWQPYLLLLDEAPALAEVLAGVLRAQFAAVLHDPYANAVNDGPTGACYEPGDDSEDPRLWERKYEVDSLAFPVLLAHRLWRATGRAELLGEDVLLGMRRVVQLWRREQRHEERSTYRFVRPSPLASESLARDGLGPELAVTGMTWSGFRPSDDACTYGYNVPANLFAARALDHVVTLAGEVFGDDALARGAGELARELRAGVARHGVVEHPRHGRVWAYEVDGLGGVLLADDANVPSLLSLPLLGACAADDPLYLATRDLVLSPENPWYHEGSAASGVGSPHTPEGYVWPIALAVEGLTSRDPERALELLRLLAATDDGTTRIHEGFHADDPSRWTREWFSWADATFCELALALLGRRVTDLDGPAAAVGPVTGAAVRRRDLGTGATWWLHPVDAEAALAALPADVERPAALPGRVPATVPGSVHTDLLAAGVVPDPLTGLHEQRVRWVDRLAWEYAAEFEVAPGELDGAATLLLQGLDTVATVTLNGTVVHRGEDMHRSHRVPVDGPLREGANRLTVRFEPALTRAEQLEREFGALPNDYPHPYNQLRKQASSFGWDWGPTLPGAGVWRPVLLEVAPRGALAGVQVNTLVAAAPAPGATRADATVLVDARVAVPAGVQDARLLVRVAGGRHERALPAEPTGSTRPGGTVAVRVEVDVPDAELWFPTGYGPPALHDVDVDLLVAGRVVDTRHVRTGFRHVALDTAPDRHGRAFRLVVNGRPVFAHGVNWIPDDPFPARTRARAYVERLEQALGAHANLVRVWGGGLFEDEEFYRACDERGLLVWQDFLLACAGYPEREGFRAEVEAESREAVRRLSAHPSVVLWNGGNENLQGRADWGWEQRLAGRAWGEVYVREVFPALLAELDPGTPFVPNSPHATSGQVTPNHPEEGTTHQWDTWNRLDHRHYRDTVPRFAAEYGWQAPATLPTLRAALGEDGLRVDSPAFLAHQKQTGGTQRLVDRLGPHVADVERLLAPGAFADLHLATSLNQAHALRTAVEHLRSWWPRSAGSVVWQLNDCWPVTSWSLVDGGGVPKLGWHAVRIASAPRIVTLQPREDGLALIVVNDTDETWDARVEVSLRDVAGTRRRAERFTPVVAPRSVATVPVPPPLRAPWHQRRELLVADVLRPDGTADVTARATWRFVEPGRVELPPGARSAELLPGRDRTGAHRVRVRADELCSDLVLLAELADPSARTGTALVTLFPGEEHEFAVRAPAGFGEEQRRRLLAPDVLRCGNEVVRG